MNNNSEIKEILARVKRNMLEYMNEGDVEYNASHVNSCMKIMDEYLADAAKSTSKEDFMKVVKRAVIRLNELNEICEHELIETGEREDLAEVIIIAGVLKGFNESDDDITEDWREW